MATALEQLGVQVWGQRVPVDPAVLDKLEALGSDDSDDSCENHLDNYDHSDHIGVRKGLGDSPLSSLSQQHFRLCHAIDSENVSSTAQSNVGLDSVLAAQDFGFQAHGAPQAQPDRLNGSDFKNSASTVPAAQRAEAICDQRLVCSEQKQLFLELVISPPDFDSFNCTVPLPREHDQSMSPTDHLSVETHSTTSASLPTSSAPVEGVDAIQRVNLDITSLIALVSSVTNGRCHLIFRDKVLTTQATEEREAPVLPVLNRFLAGMLSLQINVCVLHRSSPCPISCISDSDCSHDVLFEGCQCLNVFLPYLKKNSSPVFSMITFLSCRCAKRSCSLYTLISNPRCLQNKLIMPSQLM